MSMTGIVYIANIGNHLIGNKIIDVYVDARGGAEETATQTLPLVLKKGDMVWVRTHERYTGNTL
jgi:hypothetical protein